MDKRRPQADSAHQTGLKPTLHAFLIVVESGDRGWWNAFNALPYHDTVPYQNAVPYQDAVPYYDTLLYHHIVKTLGLYSVNIQWILGEHSVNIRGELFHEIAVDHIIRLYSWI